MGEEVGPVSFSRPALMVLHCVSVVALGDGKPDGQDADIEDVRDLLVQRFGMTVEGAEDAIAMAAAEGVVCLGDDAA